MPNPTRRRPELDGLRGLAALMVALSHFVLAFHPAVLGGGPTVSHFAGSVAISQTALILLFNPELGVTIFFVLSGYVLTAKVSCGGVALPALILRRWARLALPVLATSLLIWPLAQWHLFRSVEAAGPAQSDWLAGNYVWLTFETNDLGRLVWQSLIDLFARGAHFYNAALWTMPIEFWGSVALFVGYAALRQVAGFGGAWSRTYWLALGTSALALGLVWKTGYFGFPCGVALFAVGEIWRDSPAHPLTGPGLLVAGLFLGGMPYFIDIPFDGPYARLFLHLAPFIDNPVQLMHRVAAVCLVAAALHHTATRDWLNRPACRWLGRISFMLYLVHVPILCSLCAALFLRLIGQLGYNVASIVILAVFLAVSGTFAVLLTRIIDEPILRLLRPGSAKNDDTQGDMSVAATNHV